MRNLLFETLRDLDAGRVFLWSDPPSGLRAITVVDDVTLGPAAGGIRTHAYATEEEALRDAAALARAMTLKCALAGLAAGGCKTVVLDHPDLQREAAFEQLGIRFEELAGLVRTAGDLGTTAADLDAAAKHTRYVVRNEDALSAAVARGLLKCIEACAKAHRGTTDLEGLHIAVQGCGSIGRAVALAAHEAGARLQVSDVDSHRAKQVAARVDATVSSPSEILLADVDVVAPCAVGGVIDAAIADKLRAWAVVGAANNVLASDEAGARLHKLGVLFVPDVIASAGAVIEGIGRTVMGLSDREPLIDALGDTAAEVLARADGDPATPTEIARAIARERIIHARVNEPWRPKPPR